MTHRIWQAVCALLLVVFGAVELCAQSADVRVTKTDSPDPVIAGNNLTYTITVSNGGPNAATSVSLTDPIPANTSAVAFSQTAGPSFSLSFTGTAFTAATATFAAGASATFTMVVNVNSATAAGAVVTNTATVSSATTDPVPANNTDTETTTVQRSSDLTVTKTDSPDPVAVGNNLTYTITVSNAGPSAAATVSLTDAIPANTSAVAFVQNSGPSFSLAFTGTAFTATIPTLAAGASAVFTMVVSVNNSTFLGTTLSNTAAVTSASSDPNAANNSDTETTATSGGVVSPDLTVTQTDAPDPVLAGTNLTYTMAVTNNGPSAANAVTLSDPLPANTTFVSLAAPAGWTVTTPVVGGTGTVTATRSTLAIGSPQVFTLVVRVNPATGAATTLSNTATVSTASDPVPANNADTETTAVQRASDLSVTKTDAVDPVTVGNNLTYTITVSNAGPSDAADVSLTDLIPANTTFVSLAQISGPAFALTFNGTAVTATRPTLAAGATAVFTMVVTVNSATFFGTTLSNTVSVTSTTADPNVANNADTETTATTGGVVSPDLTVTQTDAPDPVLAGTNLTYTLTVTNSGPSVAPTVTLTDPLPANTTFVSLAAPAGWTVTTPAVGTTGTVTATRSTLAIGSPQVFTLVVRVNPAAAAGTTLSNTATVSTTNDPVLANNADTETTTVVAVALSSIYPTAGTTLGGTTVTLDGRGFEPGMAVTFGGIPASAIKVLDATRLQAIAPAHAVGAVDVVVAPAIGTATLASGYTYLAQPPAQSANDLDSDGMSDLFEMRHSLDPTAGNDAALDPDADGSSNLQEFHARSHPRGFFTRYLAEGATGAFFDLRLAVANPDAFPAAVLLRFLTGDGTTASHDMSVASLARATLEPEKTVASLAAAEFSTVVESDIQVVADRTMSWDAAGYGSHAETSIASPSTTWFLAEGATHSGFNLFYLLQNPNAATASVTIKYLLPAPAAPIVRTYTVAANTRFNIWVDLEPGLGDTDVSATITSDVPILVERAMYLNSGGLLFGAGHESAGVTATATNWFLAEGATGPFFDLFILLANPNGVAAEVTATYLLPNGSTVLRNYVVAPNSRFNIWVDFEGGPLADTAVSTTIVSTNGVGIVVERAMWWPTDATHWHEAHNSAGTTATGTRWALAEGEVGGANATETYVLIANTSPFAGSATVRLLFEDGTTASKAFELKPNSRLNVNVGVEFAAANGRRFGTIIESTGGTPAQIVVERAMYSNAGGTVWAAGTNAVATRLQ